MNAWRVYLRAFDGSMGRGWLVVLVGTLLIVVVVLIRGPACGRIAALAVVVAAAGHVVTPMTGGLVFENNLRYLHPALVLGGALLPIALARARPRLTYAAGIVAAGLVAVNLVSPDKEGFRRWPPDHRPLAVLLAAGITLGVAGTLAAVASGRWSVRHVVPVALTMGAAGLVLVGAIGHEGYADRRYQETELARIDLYRPFAEVRDERVASLGGNHVYPMFGPDLSNDVVQYTIGSRRSDVAPCLAWRELLADRFDYVVVSAPDFLAPMDLDLDELIDDPAAEQIVRNELGAVYRIDGRIDTTRCRGSA